MPRKTAFGRLIEHFHTHPNGRRHEFLFWIGLGLGLLALVAFTWWTDRLNTPLALMGAVIALCLVGWAFLPQRKPATPMRRTPGRLRAEKAAAVKASKDEGKRFKAAKRGER